MCGICGIVSYQDLTMLDRAVLQQMTDAMQHRGPDDQGIYQDHQVALGSRRLSIIDLTGGKQPISNEDETMWIVFNGEIYNYREFIVNYGRISVIAIITFRLKPILRSSYTYMKSLGLTVYNISMAFLPLRYGIQPSKNLFLPATERASNRSIILKQIII